MKSSNLMTYFFILICLIIGLMILKENNRTNAKYTNIIEKIVRDTVIKIEHKEPITITKVKPKVVYKYDTIIQSPPFIAELDTIIRTDTIYLRYNFPENIFSMKMYQSPDSLILREITFEKAIIKEMQWWEIPLYVAGGAGLGILIGLIINMGSNK